MTRVRPPLQRANAAACLCVLALASGCIVDPLPLDYDCEDTWFTPAGDAVALHIVLDGPARDLGRRVTGVLLGRRNGPPGFTLRATAPDFDDSIVADARDPYVALELDPVILEVPLDVTLDVEVVDDSAGSAAVELTALV
ncbi:MAG: hypothetical protein K1X88_33990 [Nannocystaceae bacterium]|nr:hypothetical protein [Nannocystaceae bacterium]